MLTNQKSRYVPNANRNGATSSRRMYASRIGRRGRKRVGASGAARIPGMVTIALLVSRRVQRRRYPRDVRSRLRIGGNAVLRVDRARARVVRGERQRKVVVIVHEQIVHVVASARDVLVRIEGVLDAVRGGGAGHELHEPLGTCAADGRRVTAGLGVDDRGNELG